MSRFSQSDDNWSDSDGTNVSEDNSDLCSELEVALYSQLHYNQAKHSEMCSDTWASNDAPRQFGLPPGKDEASINNNINFVGVAVKDAVSEVCVRNHKRKLQHHSREIDSKFNLARKYSGTSPYRNPYFEPFLSKRSVTPENKNSTSNFPITSTPQDSKVIHFSDISDNDDLGTVTDGKVCNVETSGHINTSGAIELVDLTSDIHDIPIVKANEVDGVTSIIKQDDGSLGSGIHSSDSTAPTNLNMTESCDDSESDKESSSSSDSDIGVVDFETDCDEGGSGIITNLSRHGRKIDFMDSTLDEIHASLGECDWELNDDDRFTKVSTCSRYYDLSQKHTVRCHSCNQPGHMSKCCPNPKKKACIYCCETSHQMRNCPVSWCYICDHNGHHKNDCGGVFRSRKVECNRCFVKGHVNKNCPDIWRQFHLTIKPNTICKAPEQVNTRKYCSNCGSSGHFNWDCVHGMMKGNAIDSASYALISRYCGAGHDLDIKRYGDLIKDDRNMKLGASGSFFSSNLDTCHPNKMREEQQLNTSFTRHLSEKPLSPNRGGHSPISQSNPRGFKFIKRKKLEKTVSDDFARRLPTHMDYWHDNERDREEVMNVTVGMDDSDTTSIQKNSRKRRHLSTSGMCNPHAARKKIAHISADLDLGVNGPCSVDQKGVTQDKARNFGKTHINKVSPGRRLSNSGKAKKEIATEKCVRMRSHYLDTSERLHLADDTPFPRNKFRNSPRASSSISMYRTDSGSNLFRGHCFRCQKTGHQVKNCPTKNNQSYVNELLGSNGFTAANSAKKQKRTRTSQT